jgi:hypothetical protein
MKYLDCIGPAQAPDETAGGGTRLADANINPDTGLATDYLNHFNEAIMLLELLPACPDCISDFLAWQPMTYREHFAVSPFKRRDLAIAAYDEADPSVRERLGTVVGTMTAVLLATREAMLEEMTPAAVGVIATLAATSLKPLVARAGAVINGQADDDDSITPQAMVDRLMKQLSA